MASQQEIRQGRKNILKAGLAMIAGLGLWNWFKPASKPVKPEKIRMLSENGELVEIDASVLASLQGKASSGTPHGSRHGKISTEELKHFVKRK